VPTAHPTSATARIAGVAALVIAVVVTAAVVLRSDPQYTIRARFVDAGQLVKGNEVQVGGRTIGSVSDLVLTNDNQALVVMKISDREFRPLHEGTVAQIRQVGLSGVANRFVELTPGRPTSRALRDGATLATSDTRPIVDLDSVLNALDPRTRASLQRVIRLSSGAFAGRAGDANRALGYLNPALSQVSGLAEELGRDEVALRELVGSAATVSSAVAAREGDLEGAVTSTAVTLRALAGERGALEDVLARAPGVLDQARPTLARLRRTLAVVRPALRDARPAAAPLARVVRVLPRAARRSTPLVIELRRLLPALRRTLAEMPALSRELVPIIQSTTRAAGGFLPIFAGLRPYAPDLVAGLYNGFGGVTAGYYDANGHYSRIAEEWGAGALPGIGAAFPIPQVGGLTGYRTGLDARCPGAAVEPAPDGSNPWVPDPTLCDPGDSHR
jgi:phospholipid/cholesterol/gamma-HCH transport system substrate-binding protein